MVRTKVGVAGLVGRTRKENELRAELFEARRQLKMQTDITEAQVKRIDELEKQVESVYEVATHRRDRMYVLEQEIEECHKWIRSYQEEVVRTLENLNATTEFVGNCTAALKVLRTGTLEAYKHSMEKTAKHPPSTLWYVEG